MSDDASPPGKPTGPPKLTDEVAARICDLVLIGLTPEEAAAGAGIPGFVFEDWRERAAKSSKNKYALLLSAIRDAQERRVAHLAEEIQRQLGEGSAQTIRLLHERIEDERRRDREGPPIRAKAYKLTESLLKELTRLIRAGTPKPVALLAVGIGEGAVTEWRGRGQQDMETGHTDTLYARLVQALRYTEAEGHGRMWGYVERGLETGRQEHVASGKLALSALAMRWPSRYKPTPATPLTPGEGEGAGSGDGGEELTVKVVLESAVPVQVVQPPTKDGES